jgi:phosphoribosyl 1,2-cyclic phosphodiesterase
VDYAVRLGEVAGAKAVLLFHHDPNRSDDDVDAIVARFADRTIAVTGAAEGVVIDI